MMWVRYSEILNCQLLYCLAFQNLDMKIITYSRHSEVQQDSKVSKGCAVLKETQRNAKELQGHLRNPKNSKELLGRLEIAKEFYRNLKC